MFSAPVFICRDGDTNDPLGSILPTLLFFEKKNIAGLANFSSHILLSVELFP